MTIAAHKTYLAIVGSVIIATALLLMSAASASADGAVRSTVPISEPIYNVCNDEVVDFTGTLSATTKMSFDANGGEHISLSGIIIANAVGRITGASYLLRSAAADEINVDSTFTTGEFTLSQTDLLIGQGQTPNMIIKSLNHMTVDANGRVRDIHVFGRFICP